MKSFQLRPFSSHPRLQQQPPKHSVIFPLIYRYCGKRARLETHISDHAASLLKTSQTPSYSHDKSKLLNPCSKYLAHAPVFRPGLSVFPSWANQCCFFPTPGSFSCFSPLVNSSNQDLLHLPLCSQSILHLKPSSCLSRPYCKCLMSGAESQSFE